MEHFLFLIKIIQRVEIILGPSDALANVGKEREISVSILSLAAGEIDGLG
jgi:hypothetical protein